MPWQYIDGQQVWIPEEGQATPPGDWFGNILSSFKSNNEQQPATTETPAPFNPRQFYSTGTNEDRINFLKNLGLSYGGGEAGTAVWIAPSGERIPESAIVQGIMEGTFKGVAPARVTGGTGGTPAYVSAAQAENYRASAELARAQAANIPVQQQLERDKQIAAEAARKFGQGAQLIGLQTGNQDLANRGYQIAFDQSNTIAQAQNRIQELALQQDNLQQQYNFNTSAANAAASNAVAQFNAQMGFNVEQANVAAQQRKQEQLQSLARDIAEAAKAPGDYGKLAALTLANAGWGQSGTAIGKGADLRTTQSLAPLESQLRTRQDVMASPERPFSYTPITPTMVQAPAVAPVDVRNFATPTQTLTAKDIKQQQNQNALSIANLGAGAGQLSPSAYMNTLANALQGGASSESVNAALNAAISNQIASLPGSQSGGGEGGVAAAAEGGIVPRYEDGGVNNSSEFNPIAVYQTLRSGGASEQQAADFINTILRSNQALASNTAAKAASDAEAAARAAQPVYQPASQRMTDASNDTEAQLLRLGMSNPYRRTSGYDEGDAAPAAAGFNPAMYSPASGGYYPAEDAAPAAFGWAPQIAQAQQQGNMQWVPAKTLTPEEFRNQENERKNREMFESIFGGLMAYPGGGAGVRGAGSLIDLAGLLRNPRTRVLMTEYAPAFDEIQRAFIKKMPGVGYATGGIAPGAYISGERGPELNIPLGDKTIVLNQKQMKAAGIDLKKLMSGSKKPEKFANGGIFDAGWGNVQDQDRTMSMQFLNDALARARAGTPFQEGALPAPVYASTPGFSPLVTQVLGSLTSMAQGVPTEYFQELAAKYRPSGIRESVTQRSA